MARPKSGLEKQVAKVEDYKKVFSTPAGKNVLLDMMAAHGMMHSTYETSTEKMLIKEGERRAVLRILGLLKMDLNAVRERIESYGTEE